MSIIRKIALILLGHFLFFCIIGYEEILRYIENGIDIHIFWRHTNYNFYLGFYLMSLVFIITPFCVILIVRDWLKKAKRSNKVKAHN
jgi:hypothetical protein